MVKSAWTTVCTGVHKLEDHEELAVALKHISALHPLNAKDPSWYNYPPRAWRRYSLVSESPFANKMPSCSGRQRSQGNKVRTSINWMDVLFKIMRHVFLYYWDPIQNAWGVPSTKLSGNYNWKMDGGYSQLALYV